MNTDRPAQQQAAFPFMVVDGAGMGLQQSQLAASQPVPVQAAPAAKPSVVIGNLPQEWGQQQVLQLIAATGQTTVAGLAAKDGHYIVEFNDAASAEAVSAKLQGQAVNERTLTVYTKPADPAPQQAVQAQPQTLAYPYPTQLAVPHGAMAPMFAAAAQPATADSMQQPQTIFNPMTATGQRFVQAGNAGWVNADGTGHIGYVNQMPLQVQGHAAGMMLPIQQAQAQQVRPNTLAPHDFASPAASPSPTPSAAHENSSILTGSHVTASTDNSPAKPRNARKKKGKKSRPSVFVGGLRPDITEREIRNFFGMFGKINHVTIKEGYAFLDFAEDAAARAAVEKCNGYMYDGKPLGVRIQDETNRRTAQEAKKQGQNVSMVFKRIEDEQGVGMPGMAGAQGMPGMQGMPPPQQQQQQLLPRHAMDLGNMGGMNAILSP